MMQVVSVSENPKYTQRAISFFQQHWATPKSMAVYDDCITHCVGTQSPLPRWYLLIDGERIVGGAGLIPNDFISRSDLWPWLCALFIEETDRGHDYARLLIERAKADAKAAGFTHLYIATDHIGYYERFGAVHIGTGYHPWDDSSRIYEIDLADFS